MEMPRPVLEREEADRALDRLSAESDRVAESLVAMDSHPGHQLLRGATLTGLTQRRWAEASTAMATLWEQFAAYRALLDRAKEVRARRSRPGPAELDELTELLTGPVVELNSEQLPIERRSLTGKAQRSERISLAELVARMKAAYTAVTEVLAEADRAWSAAVGQLDQTEQELRAVTALSEEVGAGADIIAALHRIRDELAEARQTALSDPLAFRGADPRGAELARLRSQLDELESARDSFDDRVGRLDARLAEIETTRSQARRATDLVLAKIATPALPEIADVVPGLRGRLGTLHELRRSGDWRRLSTELSHLDRAVADALTQVRTQLETITGLLDRRAELRGRLEAYRAKAERLGRAEDLELSALHASAYTVLYTAPCDLAAATRAVRQYQQAVQAGTPPRPPADPEEALG